MCQSMSTLGLSPTVDTVGRMEQKTIILDYFTSEISVDISCLSDLSIAQCSALFLCQSINTSINLFLALDRHVSYLYDILISIFSPRSSCFITI